MSVATRNLKDSVTWWSATPDGFGGFIFGTPLVLDGKWQDRVVLETDSNAKEIVSRAQVWLSADVEVGDYLYHGVSDDANPTELDGAYPVQDFRKTTDLRSLDTVRKAVL